MDRLHLDDLGPIRPGCCSYDLVALFFTNNLFFLNLFAMLDWSESFGLYIGLMLVFVCFLTGEFAFVAAISWASSGLVIDYSIGTLMTLFFCCFNLGTMLSAFTVRPVYEAMGMGGTAVEGALSMVLATLALRWAMYGWGLGGLVPGPKPGDAIALPSSSSSSAATTLTSTEVMKEETFEPEVPITVDETNNDENRNQRESAASQKSSFSPPHQPPALHSSDIYGK